ncbi:MAG: hypothetical protein RJA70_1131 [Pseudomonadota bacterium]|jgi:predicted ribosome quality control (RQC) complex YloA/Tae2 family protein
MASNGKPYRTVLVGGFSVLVGRSAKDNDDLSLRVAKGNDVWLHVAGGTPGSHVVIQNPTAGDVPPEVVEQAAQLAAWYSKSRGAPRAVVHVCKASQVSKAKGAPPGQVQIKNFKRTTVTPSLLNGDADPGDP